MGARGHQVLLDSSTRAANVDRGLVLFITRRQRDHKLRKPGDFVHLLFDREPGLKVLELNRPGRFRENRERVGVPLDHGLAERDRLPVFDLQPRAVYNVVAFLLAALFIHHGDESGAVHGHNGFLAALHDFQIDEFHEAVVPGLDLRLFGDSSRRSANVERAHGELRSRLADGLRGDDADGFAHFHEAAGGQVAAVAAGANAPP